jgi:hypothetical protein
MEEQGIAHCDLSAPNVMLPLLAGGTGVELVDLEGLYAPGMPQPQELSSGSAGYAHPQAAGGLWSPEADRFAGAVLLAEMLGWCDPQVVQAAWGESYFDPAEMQQQTPRYRTLVTALERRWGSAVAALFERAWRSDALAGLPHLRRMARRLAGTAPYRDNPGGCLAGAKERGAVRCPHPRGGRCRNPRPDAGGAANGR